MPKRPIAYLIHHLTAGSQLIVYGQEALLMYLSDIHCKVDKNLLGLITNPKIGELYLSLKTKDDICIEELYEPKNQVHIKVRIRKAHWRK